MDIRDPLQPSGNIGPFSQHPRPQGIARADEPGPGTPLENGPDAEPGYPHEADYGEQETRYDNKPPGRGHGDAGYGYGGQAGFGPSGGSDVSQ